MLAVERLTVRFGATVAVDEVSLTLPRGQVLAVLGPSGCGKSTLLRTVAGLERPATGRVCFDGHDLARVPTHRRGFALMFQDGQLFGHLDVAGNIGYPLRLRRRPRREVRSRVAELLSLVGLSGYGDRAPASLSGGERQRVALARALAVEPRLLLLDEPLSALDRDLRERLSADLREILVGSATTALLVTHDHDEAFAVADRMAVMRAGRVVQEGAVSEVWSQPADPWTARFLGYASVLDGSAGLRVLEAADLLGRGPRPSGDPPVVALRRSALAVEESGRLRARVLAARVTPEVVRLRVAVDGVGEVDAVAAPDDDVTLGREVGLRVDPHRLSVLHGGGGRP